MKRESGEFAPDPRGSAPAGSARSATELAAEAVADAAAEALKRHFPNSGSAGPWVAAQVLWVAMNRLLGPDSARHFIVFQAGRFLDDREAGRKEVM